MTKTATPSGKGGTASPTIELGESSAKPLLGRYQLEREIGRGATGIVYLATDRDSGRRVAVKTLALPPQFEAGERQQARRHFLRAAALAHRLNHPHIVTIFEAGEARDFAYLAMEFLSGKDLAPHLKPDNLLPLPRVISIIAQVAAALHHAHVHAVVHRDIKPSNIICEGASDTIKVTDFGLAQLTNGSETRFRFGLGSPGYMSPEQLAGERIDGRSDLYSLGVTFYRLLSGHLPYRGDSLPQLVLNSAHQPHIDIRTYRPELPPCVAGVIDRALAKHPAARYQTGEEMAQAIAACAAAAGGGQPEWRAACREAV